MFLFLSCSALYGLPTLHVCIFRPNLARGSMQPYSSELKPIKVLIVWEKRFNDPRRPPSSLGFATNFQSGYIEHLLTATQTPINQAEMPSARQFSQGSGPSAIPFMPQTHLGQAPIPLPSYPLQSNGQVEFEQWQRNTSQTPQLATG